MLKSVGTLALATLLSSLIVQTLAAHLISSDSKPSSWTDFHQKVYATSGKALSIDKTLEYLRNLARIYENDETKDKSTMSRMAKVKNLIDVSRISRDQCTGEHLSRINQLFDYNSPFKLNVLPFIEHHRTKQLNLCKNDISRQFEKANMQLIETQKKALSEFLKFMPEHKTARTTTNLKIIEKIDYVDGLLSYVAERLGLDNLKEVIKNEDCDSIYRGQFEQLISMACRPVLPSMEPVIGRYKLLDVGKDFINQLGSEAPMLVDGFKHCRHVIDNIDMYANETLNTLEFRNIQVAYRYSAQAKEDANHQS